MGRKESGMKRSTAKRKWKRGIAYLLTLALVFSLFSGTGFTSMASEAGVISEQNESGSSQNVTENGDPGSSKEAGGEQGATSGTKEETVSQGETEAQTGEDGNEAESKPEESAAETETASQGAGKDDEPEESGAESENEPEETGTESESESETETETVTETESETETETEVETKEETAKTTSRTLAAASEGSYAGTVTGTSLTIYQSEMENAGQTFDAGGIASLISAGEYQEGQFSQIRIIADNVQESVIRAEIFNALRPYLSTNSSSGPILLSWLFSESDHDVKWEFQKPQKDMESDLTMNIAVTFENGKAYVSVSDASFFYHNVEWAGASIILKDASAMKTGLVDTLGEANHLHLDLYAEGAEEPVSNASGFWYTDGSNGDLETLQIGSIQNLSAGAAYRLGAYDYIGDVEQNENGKKLYIDQDGLEMSGRSYDAAGIASLLANYSEGSFDEIWMAARVFDKTISPDIYNAFIPYLNSFNENRTLTFSFFNGPTNGNYLIVQSFIRPHTSSSAAAISTDAKLTVENNVITFSLPHASDLTAWAESNRMQFMVEDGTGWRDDLRNVLGSSPTTISVYDAAGENVIRDHGGNWDTDGTGKYWLNIFEIQELDANTDYTVKYQKYIGKRMSYEDENWLSISQYDMENDGQSFNGEGIAALLTENYEGERFDNISLDVRAAEENYIDADIYNALVPYLNSSYESWRIDYNFLPENSDSHMGWTFYAPSADMKENILANASFTVENDEIKVTMEAAGEFADVAGGVELKFYMDHGSAWEDSVISLLGTYHRSFSVYEGAAVKGEGGWSYKDNDDILQINNAQTLDAGTVYTIRCSYIGAVSFDQDGRKTLSVSRDEMEADGQTFDASGLSALLSHYPDGSFCSIDVISSSSGNDVIMGGIYDTFLPKLDSQLEERRLNFMFEHDDSSSRIWRFINPRNESGTIRTDVSLDAADGSLKAEFPMAASVGKWAESVGFEIWMDKACDRANGVYDSLSVLAGTGSRTEVLLYEDGAQDAAVNAEAYVFGNPESGYGFGMDHLELLRGDVPYIVRKAEYCGSIRTDEQGRRELEIDQFEMEESGLEFSGDAIKNIMRSNYQGQTFDGIIFTVNREQGMIIREDIFNQAIPYMNSENEEHWIKYSFADAYDNFAASYRLVQPRALHADMQAGFEWDVAVKDQILRLNFVDTLEKLRSHAQDIIWDMTADQYANEDEDPEHIRALYECLLHIRSNYTLVDICEDAGGEWADNVMASVQENDEEGRLSVEICHLQNLKGNTVYRIEGVYRGSIFYDSEGRSELTIDKFAMEAAGLAFNADEVKNILEGYYSGKTFDGIVFEVNRYEGFHIQADIFNTALSWLNKDNEDSWITYCFRDENHEMIVSYTLTGPTALDADIRVGFAWDVTVKDHVLSLNFLETAETLGKYAKDLRWSMAPAKNASMDEYADHIQALYETLSANRLAYDDIQLYENESGKWVDSVDASLYGNADVGMMEIAISHLQNLKTDTMYRVGEWIYRGEVSEEDEYALFISQEDMESNGQTFDGAGIAKLLSNYEEGSFDLIYIHANSAVIRADIYNAAVPYLNQDHEQARMDYSFYKDAYGCSVIWTFDHPTANLAQDASAEASLEAEDGNVAVSLGSTDVFKGCADGVSMNFELEKDSALCAGVSSILGNMSKELSLFVPGDRNAVEDVGAGWNVDEDHSRLHIYDLQNLTANSTYSLGEYIYRGNTWTDEDGTRNLWISSFGFDGAEKFGKGQLEAIINWYAEAGDKFDRIHIEEKYKEKGKTIQKDYVNLALKILDDEYDPSTDAMDTWNRLSFVFANDQDGKEDKLFWHFWNPNTAKANISADVTLTAAANAGVTYKLSSNQSALKALAQSAGIEFRVDPDLDRAKQIMTGLGEIEENEDSWLLILKAGTAWESNVHPHYGNWDGVLDLDISCVQWCAANTNYVLLHPHEVENSYNVSQVVTLGADDFALTQQPSGTVTWKTADAGVAYVSANTKTKTSDLWIVDGGETYIWASYKVGKASCLEAFHIHTRNDITGIAFDRTALTMELNYKDDQDISQGYWECRNFLNVRFTPAERGCDVNYYPDSEENEIMWTTSDPKVVALVEQHEGDRTFYNGEIEAVGPGTATVTATYLNGEGISAACDVTVLPAISIKKDEWPNLCAVRYRDTRLSDVKLPEGWNWVDPNTDLTKFYNADGHEFAAAYTYTDGTITRTNIYTLWVRIARIDGVAICQVSESAEGWEPDMMPDTLEKGEKLTLWWGVALSNFDAEEEYAEYLKDDNLIVTWTAKNGTISEAAGIDQEDYREFRKRIYSPVTKKGQQFKGRETITVTLSYRDPKKPKTVTKLATNTVSFTVVENEPFSFDTDVFEVWRPDYSYTDAKGKTKQEPSLFLYVDKDKYAKLKKNKEFGAASSDTAVLALGKQTVYKEAEKIREIEGTEADISNAGKDIDNIVLVRLPYTEKGKGTVGVTITAYGETNSTRTYTHKIPNPVPQLGITAVTINMALADASAKTVVYSDSEYPIVSVELKEDENRFTLASEFSNTFAQSVEGEDRTVGTQADIRLSLVKDAAVKKNTTYKVPLIVTVADGEQKRQVSLNLNVKIANTVPALTVKQTQKVNHFYDDEEGYGVLTVTAKDAVISKLELESDAYTLEKAGEGTWFIRLIDGKGEGLTSAEANDNKKLKKSGVLICELEGYSEPIKKTFTVATTVAKPTVLLSAKTDTLYTKLNYQSSVLDLTDKATGKELELSSARFVKKVGKTTEYTELVGTAIPEVKPQYNTFTVSGDQGSGWLNFKVVETASATKKDTFSLQVKEENWRDYIAVSYSITTDVKTGTPKIKLGSAAITLNVSEDVSQYQQVKTPVTLTNSIGLLDEQTDVWFTGNDAKSTKALKVDGNLLLQYWREQSTVVARINGSGLAAGTYKYTVWVANEQYGYKTSTTLTVKVVSKKAQQCLSVSGKGSIDVLNRAGTSMVYTPKLSNLSGKVTDGWLEGRDAGLFDWEFNEADGKLYVRAREGCTYVTGYNYQVVPAFWVQPEDYTGFSVSNAKALSISIKQGKPKITLTSLTNTLYRSSDNTIRIDVSALMGTNKVDIDDVVLLNYTEDLYFEAYDSWTDDSGEEHGITYDPESGYILLKVTKEPAEILKTGKTWILKFGIHFKGQAGNQKDTQVTYKVIIR